jgi:hypothetical protein
MIQVTIIMLTIVLYTEGVLASSPDPGRVTGEQYAMETIYARTCGLDSSKVDRFEKGIPLLLLHMKADQEAILEALNSFYRVKYDTDAINKIKNYKATADGCSRVQQRLEATLGKMDKHSILPTNNK